MTAYDHKIGAFSRSCLQDYLNNRPLGDTDSCFNAFLPKFSLKAFQV